MNNQGYLRIGYIIATMLCLSVTVWGYPHWPTDTFPFPEAKSWVNDYESIFSPAEEQALDSMIGNFERETTNQIALVTVNGIGPYESLHDYTFTLANHWGVGQAEKNNGLTMVISLAMNRVEIASGLGTEKILTDSILQDIINRIMIPRFRVGDYYEGTKEALKEIMYKWEGK